MSRVAVSTILLVAMFSFSAFAVAEIVGASIAHSESLMADAATMVSVAICRHPFIYICKIYIYIYAHTTTHGFKI